MSRSRNWVFTINNYSEEDELWCYGMTTESEFKYICVGKELGESNTPHLQGVICWTTMKSLGQMRDLHERAHWEQMRGTIQQAAEYCQKDGDFFEHGDVKTKEQIGKDEQARWASAILAVQEGRISDVPADILGRHLKSLEYAVARLRPEPQTLDGAFLHEWFYGEPGTKKSLWARFPNEGNYYIKDPKERWWDSYKDQDIVVIEDVDIYMKSMAGDLKLWLDRYPFQAPIKNGYKVIRPKKIIITSNYHPNEIWEDEMTRKAIARRVNIRLFGPEEPWPPGFDPIAHGILNPRPAYDPMDIGRQVISESSVCAFSSNLGCSFVDGFVPI